MGTIAETVDSIEYTKRGRPNSNDIQSEIARGYRLVKDLEEQRMPIVIKSVYGKTQSGKGSDLKKHRVYPPKKANGHWTCDEHVRNVDNNKTFILTEEDRKSGKIFISPHDFVELKDGYEFNLRDERGFVEWLVFKESPEIAFSHAEAQTSRATFYVYSADDTSKQNVTKLTRKAEAFKLVSGETLAKHKNIIKLLGFNLDDSGDTEVTEFIYNQADKNPNEVIRAFTDPDSVVKLMIYDGIARGVIDDFSNIYSFGGTSLGAGMAQAVTFLKDTKNSALKKVIEHAIYPKLKEYEKTPELPKEVVETKTAKTATKKKTTKGKIDIKTDVN